MSINVGIVGLGFMGRRYTEFLNKLDGVHVTAVCDIRPDVARECAEMVGAQAFAEAELLATSPNVNAIFVCTPEDRHESVSLAAIGANKAVMIEKPLAHSLRSAQAIMDAAQQKGCAGDGWAPCCASSRAGQPRDVPSLLGILAMC
ncbi:MAG: Gfo/Idh/MocA family oxidoreductase [Chloroflexi bacterium]|nr:Gfo/Idh/MocA family oxidoreductase [Chloroflexota bacterium]